MSFSQISHHTNVSSQYLLGDKNGFTAIDPGNVYDHNFQAWPSATIGAPTGLSRQGGSNAEFRLVDTVYPPQNAMTANVRPQPPAAAAGRTRWPAQRWGRFYTLTGAMAAMGTGVGAAIGEGAFKNLSNPHATGYVAGPAAAAPAVTAAVALAFLVLSDQPDNSCGPAVNCGSCDCSNDNPDVDKNGKQIDHGRAHLASDLLVRSAPAAASAAEAGTFVAIEMSKKGYGIGAAIAGGLTASTATALGLVAIGHAAHTAYRGYTSAQGNA